MSEGGAGAPPEELVRYEVAGPQDAVAILTLDSPHNRNALSRRLVAELVGAIERAEADRSVRAVLLRSADRVFCSGADLSEASQGASEDGPRAILDVQRRILASTKPYVARLAGPVRAGGIGIVAAADIVVAAEDATFALSEVRLGLAPAVISLTVLPRLTPRAASLAALGGEVFTGADAVSMGLVTRAVALEGLDAAVEDVLTSLVSGVPQGLRETKALLTRDLLARFDERAEDVAARSAALFASAEAQEAIAAFLGRPRGQQDR